MKAIIPALSFVILWFTCSSSGLCLQNPTPPGSSGDGPTSTSRTLDDIRGELKKKNATGGLGSGSSGMMGSGGSMGMGSMMGGAAMGSAMSAPGGMGAGEGSSGMDYGGDGGMGMGMGMGMGGMAAPTEKQLLAQLIQQLRGRLGSKKFKRDKVEKQLRTALQQYFDADIEERVREFDKVKARVIEMEAKLQRRLDSESEIVELQLKQMLHKADGLDFNVPSGSEGGMGGYDMMGGDAGAGDMGYPGSGMGEMSGMGMGGMGMGGMGMGGMGMSSGYGAEMGVDLTVLGYDASFGLTRLQRLDPNELDDSDPLRSYAQVNKLAEGAKTADSDTEKMSALLSALHLFEARFHHFPRTANRQTKSQPPHSWRVAILPLIGHGDLYKEYRFDQPWDSQQNLEVAKKMPELYRTSAKKNSTSFLMVVDGGSFDSSNTPPRMMDILDGTSNTIALILSEKEVAWTKPFADVVYSPNSPVPGLSKARLVGMADGTTRTLPKIEDSVFRALITRAGGEAVKLDNGAKQ